MTDPHTLQIKERPIMFSSPMVQAILADRKTMTRRVVKPQPPEGCTIGHYSEGDKIIDWVFADEYGDPIDAELKCPYQVGDHLWVRETFLDYPGKGCLYKADYTTEKIVLSDDAFCVPKWKPSIHMPKWAARIWLEVTAVRAERVWDIRNTKDNWINEGYSKPFEGTISWSMEADQWFANLWDSINAKRGYSWGSNPWVWVYTFRGDNA